jgi:hypothetical protein
MENQEEKFCRVVFVITEDEKIFLKDLAKSDRRSVSSYLRGLLIREIDDNYSE